MALKPEVSLPIALATGAVVYGVYTQFTPTVADISAAPAHDDTIDSSRKRATWTSAAIVAAISLIAKDPTVFVVGGSMVVLLDWHTRHANATNPETGKATTTVASMAPADQAADSGGDSYAAAYTG